ncbi:MAG: NfeD family protein [Clostridia bacterium]|nr:NfeD family protein [Clostridia bacterium]
MQEVLLWLVITVVLVIIEIVSFNLVTIWFAGGATAAMIAAMFHLPMWVQLILFAFVTTVLLVSTRPFVVKVMAKKTPTNSDRVIGMVGIVTEEIDNIKETGAVKADGKVWSARSAEDSIIPAGAIVNIHEIRGVKVIVSRTQEQAEPEQES